VIALEFAYPLWLLIGLAAILSTALLLWFTEGQARKRLARFVSPDLVQRLADTRSPHRIWLRHGLLLLSILLLCSALARPQWGATWQKKETRGIDLMIALDTSRSMLAEDIVPNRLERSKLAILDLLETVEGDRVGLIAFAGNAFLQCPLTLDYQAFRQTLAALDTSTIPVGGTDVASAIEEAEAYFEKTGNDRILILMTDGEDLGEAGLARAREAGERGTRIITVGVGSPKGELIPIRRPDGQRDFLRDTEGNPVSTSLDAQTLMQIAEATGGVYSALGPTGAGLIEAYQFSLAQTESAERNEMLQRIPVERFQWPLLAALFLLVAEALISNRRRMAALRSLLAPLLILAHLVAIPDAEASATEAAKAFKGERYEEAVTLYKEALVEEPDNTRLAYNLGVAAYRSGDFDTAITQFDAVVRANDRRLVKKSLFNMGNSRVAAGFEGLEDTPALTKGLWESALADYQNALALDPDYLKAEQNRSALEAAITAHTFMLQTVAEPPQGGTVSDGQAAFYGIPIKLEATAAAGWEFAGWEGENIAEPQQPTTTVSLKQDQTVLARFAKVWNLEVRVDNPAHGSAGESGIFREGDAIPLKAEAVDYFAFSGWSLEGDAEITDPAAAETEITLRGDATATARFVEAFKLSVNLDPEIGGKAGTSGFYEEYSVVPIQAEPRPGFEWIGWNGFGIKDPESLQTTVSLTSDRIVIAQMKRIWNLVIIPQPEEGGTTEGAGNHPIGSTIEIKAVPNEGYRFERWEGPGIADPASPTSFVTVASSEHTLFAIFSQEDQEDQEDQENRDQDQNASENQPQNQPSENNPQNQEEQNQDASPQEQQQQEGDPQDADNQENQNDSQSDGDQPSPAEDNAAQEDAGEPDSTDQPQPQGASQQDAQALPMSREEARQLLNALSEEERFLPAGEANERIDSRRPQRNEKDW
jgi:Ca-activated chloride channel family protein